MLLYFYCTISNLSIVFETTLESTLFFASLAFIHNCIVRVFRAKTDRLRAKVTGGAADCGLYKYDSMFVRMYGYMGMKKQVALQHHRNMRICLFIFYLASLLVRPLAATYSVKHSNRTDRERETDSS